MCTHMDCVLKWRVYRESCSTEPEKTGGLEAITFPVMVASSYCWIFAIVTDGTGVMGQAQRSHNSR